MSPPDDLQLLCWDCQEPIQIDKTFAEMREELLRQIAAGLDLPAEILTGLADLNHWSLWGIDESMARQPFSVEDVDGEQARTNPDLPEWMSKSKTRVCVDCALRRMAEGKL